MEAIQIVNCDLAGLLGIDRKLTAIFDKDGGQWLVIEEVVSGLASADGAFSPPFLISYLARHNSADGNRPPLPGDTERMTNLARTATVEIGGQQKQIVHEGTLLMAMTIACQSGKASIRGINIVQKLFYEILPKLRRGELTNPQSEQSKGMMTISALKSVVGHLEAHQISLDRHDRELAELRQFKEKTEVRLDMNLILALEFCESVDNDKRKHGNQPYHQYLGIQCSRFATAIGAIRTGDKQWEHTNFGALSKPTGRLFQGNAPVCAWDRRFISWVYDKLQSGECFDVRSPHYDAVLEFEFRVYRSRSLMKAG